MARRLPVSDCGPVLLAFYQPDIAANFGAGLRLAACLGLSVDLVEPCGFPLDDRRLKRAAMDYGGLPELHRYESFARFSDAKASSGRRVVLLTRHRGCSFDEFTFASGDTLMVGRESAGVPCDVAQAVDCAVTIPMAAGVRSLNVITALTLVLGEAMRQLHGFDVLK